MGKRVDLDKILDVLERPAYVDVLLSIVSGKNYATSIAKVLGKKQPTVTEQLRELEKLGLIRPIRRDKSKKYEINWELLLDVFYTTVREIICLREEFLFSGKKRFTSMSREELEKVIPPDFIKRFLKEYFETLIEIGGKRKGFDEVIFCFFNALENLEKEEWEKLVKKFNLDEKAISEIANLISFELSAVEQVALMNIAHGD
ncbi:ArsR family transcriptional regulator [Archaeoglobus sp.]